MSLDDWMKVMFRDESQEAALAKAMMMKFLSGVIQMKQR